MSLRDLRRVPANPIQELLEQDLTRVRPMGLTQTGVAAHLGTPTQRVNELLKGKRRVTAQTAWLRSDALGTTAPRLLRPTRRAG